MAMVTYAANCHCGRVRFTATLPDILAHEVYRCNCSVCTKNGYLLVYPKAEDVRFTAGEGRMARYCFGKKEKPHKFCVLCGTSILIDFSGSNSREERERVAVNVRTFHGIEDFMGKLRIRDVDGKNLLQPQYSAPQVP